MAYNPVKRLTLFNGGANTHYFPDDIADNQSPNPRGIELVGSGFRKARGYTPFGSEADVSDIGFKLYNHRIAIGELLIKTIGSTVKMYDAFTDAWQKITLATFTPLRRWWFASFNGYMYGGNGVDNFVRWRASAYSTLNGAILIGATTIDLAPGTGVKFPTSGTAIIEGDEFSWSGKSTDQLTGVTGVDANHASGSTVVMALDSSTYSTAPKGSVGLFFKNRIFVRDDANPNFWYHSKLADNTNPEDDLANFTIAGSGAGDAGYLILPAPVLGATVFITGGNEAVQIVFCADGISYAINVLDSGGATVGTATPFKVLGADLVDQECLAITENDLNLMDTQSNIRAMGYGEQSTTLKTARLTDDVNNYLKTLDFVGGNMAYFDRVLYTNGKQNGANQCNFTLAKFTNPDGYTFYDHWNINSLVEWKNRLYGLSSLSGKVYRMNDGYNADGSAIPMFYPLKHFNAGLPLTLKMTDRLYISGYISSNCELFVDVYVDNDASPLTFLIRGNDTNVTDALNGVALGTVVFGEGVFGGGLPDGVATRPFFVSLPFTDQLLARYYNLLINFRNAQKDVDVAVDKVLIFAEQQDDTIVKKDDVNLAPYLPPNP